MTQLSFLDSVIAATATVSSRPSAPRVISSNNDVNQINWVNGLTDPGEMIACGAYQELRRLAGESDQAYAVRINEVLKTIPENHRLQIEAAMRTAAIKRANLGTTRGKINFVSALETPWTSLGTVVDRAMNAREAIQLASMDGWDLQKVKQWIDWNGEKIDTGCYAIVRGDNGAVLTIGKSIGGRYEIFTNEENFDFADDIAGGGGKFQTAGATGNGEQVWLQMEMPEVIEHAPGDVSHTYLMLGANHDGKGAIWVFPTSQRAVCANTRRIAMNGKRLGCYFRHTKNVRAKAAQAQQALGLARKSAVADAELSQRLVATPMAQPREYFDACLDSIVDVTVAGLPLTKKNLQGPELLSAIFQLDAAERKAAEKTVEKTKAKRAKLLGEILDRYHSDRNNGLQSIAGTAWSAYNAVTETADHSAKLNKFRGNDRTRQESRFESVLEGKAADTKDMALETILALAK